VIAAIAVVRTARRARALRAVAGSLVIFLVVLLGAAGGALTGDPSTPAAEQSDAAWGGDAPAEMEPLYAQAAQAFGVPLAVLEAVGKVETDHCRDPLAMTPNFAGAVGCMQLLPSTFERWAAAAGSPSPSILDPRDSVFAAAAKLSADGVAADPWQALWAYNHSDEYVAGVLAWAVAYGWRTGDRALLGRAVLVHAGVFVRNEDMSDLAQLRVDPRLLMTLLALATRYRLAGVGPFTRHSYYVAGTTRVSNHVFGRAVDIGTVDGALVRRDNAAAHALVVDALGLPADIRPDEVLSPWAMQVGHARGLTNADHQDHVHIGFDSGGTP
jgi:hypothetical protein